jgi:hypothetical protein
MSDFTNLLPQENWSNNNTAEILKQVQDDVNLVFSLGS